MRKKEKPHGENPSSKMDMAQNLNEYLHSVLVLHLNKLDVLLLSKKLCRVVVDALIMYQIFNGVKA